MIRTDLAIICSAFARRIGCVIALAAIVACAGCRTAPVSTPQHADAHPTTATLSAPPALIPAPYSLKPGACDFELRDGATLRVNTSNPEFIDIARRFIETMQRTRGWHFQLQTLDLSPPQNANASAGEIEFAIVKPAHEDDPASENYLLTVSTNGIQLVASDGHGLFNGTTTLWQLLTPDNNPTHALRIPCLQIEDQPRFAWRGLMLDSARHFQPPADVKRFIDAMALHKFNVLHWHLTDDQGWRIEIKRYPKLTEVGAWRQPAGAAGFDADGKPVRYGGFYTQDEIRDIVAYAQARYITIVPEIEMPGHAQAAIAAYPELGVTGKNPGVSHDWGVHTYLYNVEDSTFSFLENVLSETMALFPSTYIHIGGDEAAKDQWQASRRVQQRMRELQVKDEAALQGYFTARIGRFLTAHGRKLIGWDEILEGGQLPEDAAVMSWRGSKGAVSAAKAGHDVVLSPDPDLYFDHLAGNLPDEPAGRPSVISLKQVYAFQVVPAALDADQAKRVLGAQANLWSEYFPDMASVEYAAFPRAAALAEVLWSPPDALNWPGFLERLPAMQARYRGLGINYAQSPFAVHIDREYDAQATSVRITLSNQTGFGAIHYTLDGSAPTMQSALYTAPFAAPARCEIRAAAFDRGQALADAQVRKLDPPALLRRSSAELASCRSDGGGVLLKLPDDKPTDAQHQNYLVDIFDPCWRWPQADLDGIGMLTVNVASLPYNFQLWKDIKSVVDRQPQTFPLGELQIRLDGCDGPASTSVSLAPLLMRSGTTQLHAEIPAQTGKHDICLRFATGAHEPLRVVDWVQLSPVTRNDAD